MIELEHVCGIEGCRSLATRSIRVIGSDCTWAEHHEDVPRFMEMEVRVCGSHYTEIMKVTARWFSGVS